MKPTGAEAIKFLEKWNAAHRNVEAKARLIFEYGVSHRRLRGWAEEFRRQKVTELPKEKEVVYTSYPEFKLKPFKMKLGERDEEDIVIVMADHHCGKITPNFNVEIYKQRMDKLLDDTMLIINLHRPIRKAHIFSVGDIVQGENIYQGSMVEEADRGARRQINEIAVPIWARYILSLKQGVSEVNLYGVRGNHGVGNAKGTPPKTNWDLFFYDALKAALTNQTDIGINYSEEFSLLVNIKGFRFFLIHGDQCKGNAAVPVIAMRRKMSEWYANSPFHYAYCGHFHSEYQDKLNSVADYTIAPPLVTGDEWAVEKIGRISTPQQLCFGVHARFGRTWRYSLHTDTAFLPRRFNENEGVVKQ